MTARNGWEENGRARKVARFIAAFNRVVEASGGDQTSPEAAAEILRQLASATDPQWTKLAEDLGEKKAPSPTTRAAIVAHYAHIANSRHLAGDETEQEAGRERYAVEGECAGHHYKVTARRDSNGFSWSVHLEGEFLRGGYSRGPDVLQAFAGGRALVEGHLNEKKAV